MQRFIAYSLNRKTVLQMLSWVLGSKLPFCRIVRLITPMMSCDLILIVPSNHLKLWCRVLLFQAEERTQTFFLFSTTSQFRSASGYPAVCHSFCIFYADLWEEMFCLAGPEPLIRLERMEETTNKISLALEIQEEGLKTKPGRCFALKRQTLKEKDITFRNSRVV